MNNLELEDIKLVAESKLDWDKLTNKKIIISGGTGFIGSFICNVIRYRNKNYNQNIKVFSISRRERESNETVKYISGDIIQKLDLPKSADYVLHLASNTHPAQYKTDPVGTIINNIYGCKNLLDYCKDNLKTKFLLASSCEVYGECTDKPVEENYSGYINFNTTRAGYNEAKRVCESLCQSYKDKFNVNFSTFRLARVFGADKTKNDTKAMAQFIEKAINNEDIVLKSKGNQRYSYIYVADAVIGIFCILFNGENGEAYNISSDDENLTLSDYANYIANFCGKKVVYEISEDSSVSKANNALLSNKKIKNIGFRQLFSVKEAIERTIKIYKN